ncbi:MAG: penicillin-binding protein 1A [Desulfobacterales bacterium]|nr:penicillin-binding protein 1A [Desulfobacterales bacterium]
MANQKKSKSEIMESRAKQKKRGLFSRLFKIFRILLLLMILVGIVAGAGLYYYISEDLPLISSLNDYRPPIITTVYSSDNRKIAEFYKERRVVVALSKMPKMLLDAFVSAEDARFYEHGGIDVYSIIRAFFKNLEAGTIVQGGSTITQQVTKSFFLTPERNYSRKIKEAILAYRIDKTFAKDEILYLYLNQIYLGHGAYGVQAAAQNYFGKDIEDLNLAECAMLAGLPQAPSNYSPFRFPERAKTRQIYVLNRMVAEGHITNTQATEAIDMKLDIKPRKNWYIEKVPYYTEHIRRYLEKTYGSNILYKEGLKVYAAVDIEMQRAAREEIQTGLYNLDKRQGYRGPLEHLAPESIEAFVQKVQEEIEMQPLETGRRISGVVIGVNDEDKKVDVRIGNEHGIIDIKDMRWARKPNPEVAYNQIRIERPGQVLKVGDVIEVLVKKKFEASDSWHLALEQTPKVESALLCIESETGQVKAMVGGRDFMTSQFNRAYQSRRQPGSAFKPIVYSAALDKGYTPATVIIDSPIVFQNSSMDFTWKPKNYEMKFYGPTLLREALTKSRNVVTIKILQDIGIDYVLDYSKKMGINSPLSRDLSIALGSSGISLLEIVNAYSVFANYGYMIEPVFITRIEDRDGNIIEETNPVRKKVIDQSTAYIMTSMLESVVQNGTGRRVKALNRPVAGKTGTTNNLFDAWFVGYTPRYITGTWVGFDNEAPLGKFETGSRAASPIWLGFMKRVLEDKPVRVFKVPEGVVFSRIDAETGLLPIPESKKTIFECFKEGTVPTEYTKSPDEVTDSDDFFKNGL